MWSQLSSLLVYSHTPTVLVWQRTHAHISSLPHEDTNPIPSTGLSKAKCCLFSQTPGGTCWGQHANSNSQCVAQDNHPGAGNGPSAGCFPFADSLLTYKWLSKTGLSPFPQSSLLGTKSEKEERLSAVAQPRRGWKQWARESRSKRDSRCLAVLSVSMSGKRRNKKTRRKDKIWTKSKNRR